MVVVLSSLKKMKLTWIIAVMVAVLPFRMAIADSPASPFPWVILSERGDYLFKMVPAKWRQNGDEFVIDRKAFGVAYKITDAGEFAEMWRTEDWYTFNAKLSEDGQYLVRFGPWASDQEKHTDLAIAFYHQGKLIKQYQVRELIAKPELLEESVSHYRWVPTIQTKPNGFYGGTFHLVMVDKTSYSFDYETGEILIRDRDEGAKSEREIWAEERAAAKTRGEELFAASPFKAEFERHFEVSGIEAMRGTYSSCSLEGKTWTADLRPRKEMKPEVGIEIVLPVVDDKRIEASVTPKDLLAAVDVALKHPFVAKRFASGGATGIRLRTQGDRLHWNTPELIEFLTKLTGATPKEGELGHWAYFIVDANEPRYTSLYLNTKTGEVIFDDNSKWPSDLCLIDATGKRTNANKAQGAKVSPDSMLNPDKQ